MKIIVLGGAGDMGSHAVEDLAENKDVSKIILADLNEKKAKNIIKELDSKKVYFRPIDLNNHGDLVEKISDADVVVGCAGPFYKFEKKAVLACLEAKKNYVSICDDYDAAASILDLDKEAKEKGVTILTGLGWTPGISNILVRHCANQMDKIEEAHIAWSGSSADAPGYAVMMHTLHIFMAKITTFRDGEEKQINGGTEKEIVRFPAPIGELPVYSVGHPEPVTIPRFIKGIKIVTLKGGLLERELAGASVALARIDALPPFSHLGQKFPRLMDLYGFLAGKVLVPVFETFSPSSAKIKPISGLRVDTVGKKNNKTVKLSFGAADRMYRLTSIPVAIGAWLIGKGEINKKGIFPPEAIVKPESFFSELEKRDVKIVKM